VESESICAAAKAPRFGVPPTAVPTIIDRRALTLTVGNTGTRPAPVLIWSQKLWNCGLNLALFPKCRERLHSQRTIRRDDGT
jgi:hypothetical protein